MKEDNKQPEDCILKKITQLHECLQVRHGVMLVGPTGSGKTTVLHVSRILIPNLVEIKFQSFSFQTLAHTYNRLHEMGISGAVYQPVHMYVINPKAVTIGELYGQVDLMTNEWHDGLIGSTVRHACSVSTNHLLPLTETRVVIRQMIFTV